MDFMNKICGYDKDKIFYLQVLCGAFLTGDTSLQSLFLLIGKGASGKSTFANVIRLIMGPYCKSAPETAFSDKNSNSNFELASIAGARLVIISEESDKNRLNEPLIKRITGGEAISCCNKYGPFFEYIPHFKLLMITNEVPYISSQGYDMKRRIKAIPFNQRFTEKDPDYPLDSHIFDKLKEEKDSIFAWFVLGTILYYESYCKLPCCHAVNNTGNEIFEEQDNLGDWLETYFENDKNSFTLQEDLWQSYCNYCTQTETKKTYSCSRSLAKNLAKRDEYTKIRKTIGVGFLGLKKKNIIYNYDDFGL